MPFPVAILAALLAVGQAPHSATELLEAGKATEARDAFESTLAANPEDQSAQHGEVAASEQIALQQRAQGHMVDALHTLLRAKKYAPHSGRLACDLGILEDEMHLYPEAAQSLARAEQFHYDSPSLLYAQARVLFDQQQLGPAAQKMRAYLQLRPNDATAHYGLGRIDQLGLQFDKARQEFQESVRLQPAQTEAWYQLGDIALKQNRYDEALSDFNKTLERDPHHGGALAGAGEACFHQKRYDQALDYLNRAVAAAPDYEAGHYYLGLTLARLGRKEESQSELATAAKLADAENKRSSTRYQITTPVPQQ